MKSGADYRADGALRDETRVCVRAIRPDDKERLRIGFERLSPRSVYHRFFYSVKELTADVLRGVTEVDFRDHVALVLTVEDEHGERLIAEGSFVRVAPGADSAEIGVIVGDAYQGRGAGTLLLQHLVGLARAGGIRELVALVLDDNWEMLELIEHCGLPLQQSIEDGVQRVVMRLDAES